jgi:ribonuclease BN (tRNA processing enzyme)
MKITLLGTNGWFDTATGNTPCVLLQTDDFDIIFDAGNGFSKIDHFIDGRRPVYLLLSHFHLDHLIGLHTLPKNNFKQGLTILGLPGVEEALNGLLTPPYAVPLQKHAFPVHITALNGQKPTLPFGLTSLPLIHSGPCLGYRVEVNNRVITYCTDTGYCENAVALAQNADIFMTECSLAPGVEPHPQWPHLGPSDAARIASEAHVQRLLLIHFDPTHYPTLVSRDAAEIEARLTFPNSVSGHDGMEFHLA